MGKVITLNRLLKEIKPNTATLIGGGFDLFHVGHLRYLKKCSSFGKPLVVIVQSDSVVFARKGFGRPIIGQNQRAHLVSSIECVDYVVILDKPSHYDGYLEKIKPKRLIFYRENLVYRIRRAKEIRKKFPHIKVIFVKNKKITSTSSITEKNSRVTCSLEGHVIFKNSSLTCFKNSEGLTEVTFTSVFTSRVSFSFTIVAISLYFLLTSCIF